MNVSVIATVLNEADAIEDLLLSLATQTRSPDEVIILDGGSRDGTPDRVRQTAERLGLNLRLLQEPGANISRGRNLAIAAASSEIIAATDAGVRLEPGWLAALVRHFFEPESDSPPPDVVGGFFASDPHSLFELALGAATLPLASEIDPVGFLPSSRSVAFTKAAWRAAGGYPEWLDYCEDLVFDFALRDAGCRFAWAPDAVAHFRPRPGLAAFFRQYYRYARGDGKADLWRKRHAIRYAAYLGGAALLLVGKRKPAAWGLLAAGAAAHLRKPIIRLTPQLSSLALIDAAAALALLPVIVATGDVAKMLGYPVGVWKRLVKGQNSTPENAKGRGRI
ncbi:MAG: glycosyltransferase [Chloroflexi bacterium]|nr:glycosyltransferase [Chloroflexota bacterium]